MPGVLLIGTVETKKSEIAELSAALSRHGLSSNVIDISLGSGGRTLSGPEKIARMEEVIAARALDVVASADKAAVAVGLGGGTGGEIALAVLKALPATYPKVLISTMAFDPRDAVADCAITLVPTLCDLEGLNPMLRQVFENTAAMVAGLATAAPVPESGRKNIALTTLGATGPAGTAMAYALDVRGYDTTVFHSNGYGGAALAQFLAKGGAEGVIDLNVHELGRLRLAGAHVPMPTRFRAAGNLPRVVLPGALNFLGLGALSTLSEAYRARPHYQHSGLFTHVQLTEPEMADQAVALAAELNHTRAPCHVLLPMGGFSHQDRPGGAIEAPELRQIAADVLESEAQAYTVARIEHHINSQETADAAVSCLLERMPDG
jgi:uncharacterized protein (UPF0261 family)